VIRVIVVTTGKVRQSTHKNKSEMYNIKFYSKKDNFHFLFIYHMGLSFPQL